MLQRALFPATVFGELPLCCLNVYMEQLGGLKTDMVQEFFFSTIRLFPGQQWWCSWCFDKAVWTTSLLPGANNIKQIKQIVSLGLAVPFLHPRSFLSFSPSSGPGLRHFYFMITEEVPGGPVSDWLDFQPGDLICEEFVCFPLQCFSPQFHQ